MGLELADGVLTLVPDQAFLADAATVYPVTVDPTLTPFAHNFWATMLSGKPDASYPWRSADPNHPDWSPVLAQRQRRGVVQRRWRDADLDLGAREYDPVLGRFLSDDPVTDAANPQQTNGYAYSNNSPITFADPTGMFCDGCETSSTQSCWGNGPGCGPIAVAVRRAFRRSKNAGVRNWTGGPLPRGTSWIVFPSASGYTRRTGRLIGTGRGRTVSGYISTTPSIFGQGGYNVDQIIHDGLTPMEDLVKEFGG